VFVNFASGYPVKSSKYFAYKYIGPRNITQWVGFIYMN
jgi:hypothetical protein